MYSNHVHYVKLTTKDLIEHNKLLNLFYGLRFQPIRVEKVNLRKWMKVKERLTSNQVLEVKSRDDVKNLTLNLRQ